MARRTHIDHLLDRRGITKTQHARLKAEETAERQAAEDAASRKAEAAITKAMVDCGECPRISTGCEFGKCLRS